MYDADVVIIGAGLTGLRAALEFSRGGLSVLVFEQSQSVGGRLRTSREKGALLDQGFQVLLSRYPEFSSLPDLSCLDTKPFWSGARVRVESSFYDVYDPLRHPIQGLRSLFTPVVRISDLVRLGLYTLGSPCGTVTSRGVTTEASIDKSGFSVLFAGAFLKPFLRGVLLDATLSSDAGLAKFYLRTFSRGAAVLPAEGIQALPELLADTLGREHILLGSQVSSLHAHAVVFQNGDEVRARKVICAADSLAAAALGGPEQTVPQASTVTLYFLADAPPYTEPLIVLNGDGNGPINNLAVPSNVQPTYAPPGAALIAASIVGHSTRLSEEKLLAAVRAQLHEWFGSATADWEYLRTFSIPNALPARPRIAGGWCEFGGVFFAGDYLSYGSQNGALAAGRAVAHYVLMNW